MLFIMESSANTIYLLTCSMGLKPCKCQLEVKSSWNQEGLMLWEDAGNEGKNICQLDILYS